MHGTSIDSPPFPRELGPFDLIEFALTDGTAIYLLVDVQLRTCAALKEPDEARAFALIASLFKLITRGDPRRYG